MRLSTLVAMNQNQAEQHSHNHQFNTRLQTARKSDGIKFKNIPELYKNTFFFIVLDLSPFSVTQCELPFESL